MPQRRPLLAQVVDDKFTEIESIGAQLTSARWFQKVRSQSEILNASLTMLERQDICQQMQTYYAILQVAESVALLLPEKGQAVDRVSFWEEERYFSSVGLPGNLMDDPDVQDSLAASYNSMVVLPGKDGDFYVFKQLNYAAHPDAVLFCLINDSWFQQFLSQRFADSLGSLEIISEGEPVFSMTQEEEDPDQWQHFELDSSLYQWDYSIRITPPQMAFASQTLLLVSPVLVGTAGGGGPGPCPGQSKLRTLVPADAAVELAGPPKNEQEFQAMEHVFQELGRQNQDFASGLHPVLQYHADQFNFFFACREFPRG